MLRMKCHRQARNYSIFDRWWTGQWIAPTNSDAPYYSSPVTAYNQEISFSIGRVSAILTISSKENCIDYKRTVATIYLDFTSNQAVIINSGTNLNLTASANLNVNE